MKEEAERLFEHARGLNPETRTAWVDHACAGDRALREELLELLVQADAAEEFFQLFADAVQTTRFPLQQAEDRADGATSERAPPSPRFEHRAGAVVGHYRILSVIGSGGMGTVYRAHDTVLERQVALKFLPPLSTRLDDEERLLKEARSAGSLQHPNICTIHEIGQTDDGRPFIAMALYEGETLTERLRRGPLPVEEAVTIAVQIGRGLEAAHARGILHRDVKPGNVIVGTDGTARLLDFGLATVVEATISDRERTPGTLAYMSPEQVRGDSLDARTDLWSLGVVLYEMLAGRRPFRGEIERTLVQSILDDDPEPLPKQLQVPRPLAALVERLLSKDPGSRHRNAAEVVADLTQALPTKFASGLRSRPRHRTAFLAGSAAVLAALVGIGLWLPGRLEQSSPVAMHVPREPSIAVLPLANLSADPRDAALAGGMTEALIATLAGAGDVRVIASTSVLPFQGSQTDVRTIADSLGVSNILEGGFQKIGSRFRVQVRLVDARDGSTRWSQTYDREFEDVFAVQDDIARAVAGELELRFDKDRQLLRHGTRNIAAYELYLRGWNPALLRSQSGIRERVGYFQQAIATDSTYAAAHAGLALAHLVLGYRSRTGMPLPEWYALAEMSARKAVALDDSLAEAHYALGRVWLASYHFPSAETEIERAIALDPTRSSYRRHLASLRIWAGRPTEALTETRRALEIDPLNPYAHAAVAEALFANHRYDEALAQLERIAAIQPPLQGASAIAGQCYAKKEMWPEAIAALRPLADTGDSMHLALLGHTLARAGQRKEANRILADLIARQERTVVGAFEIAVVYAGLGDFDQAFGWLDRSVDDKSLDNGIMEPTFEDLRQDPRFERLARRLGLQKL
ncbi:serine/threonine-protein kinase [soil metagenome]